MIGIISDVHGNYPALVAVMEELEKEKCDTIISLGDIAGYYCMINECIELLKEKNVVNIMGNHDYYITKGITCPRSYSANLCLDYQRDVINNDNFKWLSNSVEDYNTDLFWAVHGGWNNKLDEYIEKFDFSVDSPHKIYISGHTHIQHEEKTNTKVYFNPGSVGQPRDNNGMAAYGIISGNGNIKLKRIKYDIDFICNEMKKNKFPERIYSCLYYGVKIGENT